MADKVEKLLHSTIQHGKDNDRIYLMHLDQKDPVLALAMAIEQLAQKNNYSKIFIKIPENNKSFFESYNYIEEATIPKFFKGKTTAVFMSKYLKAKRKRIEKKETIAIKSIICLARDKAENKSKKIMPIYKITKATHKDALEMSKVYKKVFETYPFPIHNPEYIKETMKAHIDYYLVKKGTKVVAVSSAEMDLENKNVEMTDFATLESHRGNDLSIHLLKKMEQAMKKKKIKTAYTIARSLSAGMNICFAKCGYKYSGTLRNNTNICGNIESMNVWHKSLS